MFCSSSIGSSAPSPPPFKIKTIVSNPVSSPEEESVAPEAPSLEKWLLGRAGVGAKHHFAYRVAPERQGGLVVEVLSRGMAPPTSVDRFLGAQARIDTLDRRLFEELKQATIGLRQVYVVPPVRAGRILAMMKSMKVFDARNNKSLIWKGAVKPMIVDHVEDNQITLSVRWLDEAGEPVNWVPNTYVIFDDFPALVMMGNHVYEAPAHLLHETFRRLVAFPQVSFDAEQLSQSISRLEQLFVDLMIEPGWLASKLKPPITEALAKKIFISFSGEVLRLEAKMQYGQHAFSLRDVETIPEETWTCAEAPFWTQKIVRDRPGEMKALQILRDVGFKHVYDSVWELEGNEALDLVKRELAPFLGEFEIYWSKPLAKNSMFRTTPLRSVVRVANAFERGWFDVDVEFKSGDTTINVNDIADQVTEETRFVRLSDGTYAELTPALRQAIRLMKNLLEEREKDGKAKFDLMSVGEVETLLELADEKEVDLSTEKFIKPFRDFSAITQIEPPSGFNAQLRDYQKEGVSWMSFLSDHKLGGILADDMGLGKTVQTLAWLKHLRDLHGRKPSLVVCPTSVVENWVRETHRFVPDFVVHRVDGPHRAQYFDSAAEADVLVTSYGLFRRDFDKVQKIQFRAAILDEAQAIKNPASQTAQCVKKIDSQMRLALTGTPIENRLSELWSIFDFASPGLLSTLSDFRERYQSPIERYRDNERLGRLKNRIRPFVLRREKEVVAKELPPKTMAQVFCDVPEATKQLYRQIAEKARDHLSDVMRQKGFERSSISILTELLRLRQICCDPKLLQLTDLPHEAISPKIGPFLELVEEALASGRKILVFSQFVSMLDILSKELKAKEIDYLMLTGATRRRQEIVDRFQSDDGPRIFLISLKAGGAGLNLTAADCVIHFDPWWNPAVEEQATDRAHRIGQTKPVFVYELVARNTVEEKIIKLKERKRMLSEGVLGVDGALAKLLSEDEVMELFDVDEWNED